MTDELSSLPFKQFVEFYCRISLSSSLNLPQRVCQRCKLLISSFVQFSCEVEENQRILDKLHHLEPDPRPVPLDKVDSSKTGEQLVEVKPETDDNDPEDLLEELIVPTPEASNRVTSTNAKKKRGRPKKRPLEQTQVEETPIKVEVKDPLKLPDESNQPEPSTSPRQKIQRRKSVCMERAIETLSVPGNVSFIEDFLSI
jgi:hypothetical protein